MPVGRPWTEEEIQIIKDNPSLETSVLADKLGRTKSAIEARRWQIAPSIRRGKGLAWTPEDIAFVRENRGESTKLLGEILGRTPHAIAQLKTKFNKEENTAPELADIDRRPTGWYQDTIGILLLSFPDVMATWRHFHKYVKVEYMETQKTGWVTVKCYRDADCAMTEEEFLELPYS
jgi:hypothetical protein